MATNPPHRQAATPGGKGHFPGFDVLAQVDRWDQSTAGVVLARVDPAPEFSFFTPGEQAIAGPLFDLLLDQYDEPKVPVLLLVDHRLALDETDGWFFHDMPEDGEAWRVTLAMLDDDCQKSYGLPFHTASRHQQAHLVQAVQDADEWHEMAASHVWSLWTRYACSAFYSHPWAWNEIGFGGPAYPRGYQALGVGKLEHWEVADRRPPHSDSWAERVKRTARSHHELTGWDRGDP